MKNLNTYLKSAKFKASEKYINQNILVKYILIFSFFLFHLHFRVLWIILKLWTIFHSELFFQRGITHMHEFQSIYLTHCTKKTIMCEFHHLIEAPQRGPKSRHHAKFFLQSRDHKNHQNSVITRKSRKIGQITHHASKFCSITHHAKVLITRSRQKLCRITRSCQKIPQITPSRKPLEGL